MSRLLFLIALLAAVFTVAAGAVILWPSHRRADTPLSVLSRGGSTRLLTVQGALGLCPRQPVGEYALAVGTVTVDGYLGRERTIFVGHLQGLFPSKHAAQTASSRTTESVYPPSGTAVWLHGPRLSSTTTMLSVTGKLECTGQRGGAGGNSGTFAWLTPAGTTR